MQLNFTAQVNGGKKHHNLTYRDATLFLIGILFIPGLNIYAAGFLSGMIGSKGDLKQRILGTLTAGFRNVFLTLNYL
jgi:hypothetical protein